MHSPRLYQCPVKGMDHHYKHAPLSPRTTVATYALPYKQLDPFASSSSSSSPRQAPNEPFASCSNPHSPNDRKTCRKTPRLGESATPKSLSSMQFDSSASAALFSMLPATPTTPAQKYPAKPQHPHPRTSVAATADFLETLRAKSLLDYKFMRDFSLGRKKPVEERSLSKMSANSMYSMRMAQLSLEDQGRSFVGRQQWLMKPEPLQPQGDAASAPKSDDEIRGTSSVESSQKGSGLRCKRNPVGRRSLERKPPCISASMNSCDDSVSCFPTLWGEGAEAQLAYGKRSVPHMSATHRQAAETGSNHDHAHHSTSSHRETAPPTSVLIWQDLSGFDLRKCHPSSVVAHHHGFLTEQDIPKLMEETGYNRTELYALWARFKALCSISKTPKGIDKDTFHRGLPQVSVEDDFFIDRVFTILDADGSGILEWQEFVEALSALEKGDVNKRVGFLFRVYDLNGDGTIHRNEAMQFFLASLLISANDEVEEVARHFINKIYAAVGCANKDSMGIEDAIAYMKDHPLTDIYSLFGRTMVSTRQQPAANPNSVGKIDHMATIIG